MTSAACCARSLASAIVPPEHSVAVSSAYMKTEVPVTCFSFAIRSADQSKQGQGEDRSLWQSGSEGATSAAHAIDFGACTAVSQEVVNPRG